MENLKLILVVAGVGLLVGWASVLAAMLSDKIAGRSVTNFIRPTAERLHLAPIRPLSWWGHLIRLPLYLISIPTFLFLAAMFIPPMWLAAKIAGQRKEAGRDDPTT